MLDITHTQTLGHLERAFEYKAASYVRYLSFADKARDEGFNDIAELFDELAEQQLSHSKVYFSLLSSNHNTESALKFAKDQENSTINNDLKWWLDVSHSESEQWIHEEFMETKKLTLQRVEKVYTFLVRSKRAFDFIMKATILSIEKLNEKINKHFSKTIKNET